MKHVLSLIAIIIATASLGMAQKVAYVDTKYILEKIPEYATAQEEVERISEKWQEELEEQYQQIEQFYADYQAQEVLLPEDVKQEKQEEIFQAERAAKEFREKKVWL